MPILNVFLIILKQISRPRDTEFQSIDRHGRIVCCWMRSKFICASTACQLCGWMQNYLDFFWHICHKSDAKSRCRPNGGISVQCGEKSYLKMPKDSSCCRNWDLQWNKYRMNTSMNWLSIFGKHIKRFLISQALSMSRKSAETMVFETTNFR